MNLEHLRAFCLVSERGGFAAAARELGVQKGAISKSVKKLEETLGVRLLERSSRAVRPTDAGKSLLTRGRELLVELDALADDVKALREQVRGELRVAATLDVGAMLSRWVVPELHGQYPELKVALALSYDVADLYSEDIDVALRIGFRKSSTLVGTKVGEVKRGLFASPEYLERRSRPRDPTDLEKHSLLGFKARHRDELTWTLSRADRTHHVAVEGAFCSMNFQALCQAAAGGLGIAALPEEYLAEPIRGARLVKVLSEWSLPRAEIFALYPSRSHKPAKLQAFLEALKASKLLRG